MKPRMKPRMKPSFTASNSSLNTNARREESSTNHVELHKTDLRLRDDEGGPAPPCSCMDDSNDKVSRAVSSLCHVSTCLSQLERIKEPFVDTCRGTLRVPCSRLVCIVENIYLLQHGNKRRVLGLAHRYKYKSAVSDPSLSLNFVCFRYINTKYSFVYLSVTQKEKDSKSYIKNRHEKRCFWGMH